MDETTQSRVFRFDSLESAALGLTTVLQHARKTNDFYVFGPLSAPTVLSAGLTVTGQLDSLSSELDKIPGTDWSEG